MLVYWGSYLFTPNSCRVSAQQHAVLTDAGVPYLYDTRVRVEGRLAADGQAACSAAEANLRAALSVPYQDFGLRQDDGAASSLSVRNAQTVGGTVVVDGPNFPARYGAEFATFREFDFTVGFLMPVNGPAVNGRLLVRYSEELAYSGGAPEFKHKLAINGPPQLQRVWALTPFRVVQAGSAVGFLGYPDPPAPVSPANLMTAPEARRRSPRRVGGAYVEYQVDWNYVMESAGPIGGLPHLWTDLGK